MLVLILYGHNMSHAIDDVAVAPKNASNYLVIKDVPHQTNQNPKKLTAITIDVAHHVRIHNNHRPLLAILI